jgi:pimeloyl-ACP methyl ester carboxylesterase
LRRIAQDNARVWLRANRPFDSAELDPAGITRIEDIGAPALIIVGERDVPDIHTIADLLEARLPQARRIMIPHVGHIANMEAPHAFNEAVLEFLTGGSRKRP